MDDIIIDGDTIKVPKPVEYDVFTADQLNQKIADVDSSITTWNSDITQIQSQIDKANNDRVYYVELLSHLS